MKQKILMIFYRPPLPLHGGDKIRMFQNLKVLSKKFDLDILYIDDNKTDIEKIEKELLQYVNNIYRFSFPKCFFYLNLIKGFFNNLPFHVNYFYFRKINNWVEKNHKNYDKFFCTTIRTTEYLKGIKVYKIIDFVDAISMNYTKAYKNKKIGLLKLFYYLDSKRTLRYEKNILIEFNRHAIISNIDKNFLIEKTGLGRDIKIVHNSVNSNYKESNNSLQEKNIILFVGKMNYEPNVTAVLHFIKNIFPKILKDCKDAEFHIVGAFPSRKVNNIHSRNVFVKGFVKDLDSYYNKSKIVVAPMISGAGIQNKVLMAMANQKCVVTTTTGSEGLLNLSKKDQELTVVDSNLEMSKVILDLLKNDYKRDRIGEKAKQYVKEYYSEKTIEDQFDNLLK